MRVVASISAVDSDKFSILQTFESLRNQNRKFDKIYITIRPDQRKIFSELSDFCELVELSDNSIFFAKIYGPLTREHNPDTLIISLDPGIICGENITKIMINKHKNQPGVVHRIADGSLELFVRSFFPQAQDLRKLFTNGFRKKSKTVRLVERGMVHNSRDLSLREIEGGRLLFIILFMLVVVGVYYSL